MPYKNIDIKRAHARLYYWLNKDKIKNGMGYNKDNRNKRRRDYYKNNRTIILVKHKEWREKDGNKYRRYERKKIYYEEHKKEISIKSHDFYLSHPTRKLRDMEAKNKIKVDVLTHYGNGKCACVKCGFDDIRALSIDHINGGGTKERNRIGGNRYRQLQINNYPIGLQTLCMNCQFIKKIENKEDKWHKQPNLLNSLIKNGEYHIPCPPPCLADGLRKLP